MASGAARDGGHPRGERAEKVREAVAILDLDVLYRPCPKDGTRYRPEAIQKGGKQMFPYMEDPNTGKAMVREGGRPRRAADD